MLSRWNFVFSAVLSGLLICFTTVHAASTPTAPQTLVLKTVAVGVSTAPTTQPHARVTVPRHFANPALIGEIKAALAAGSKPSPHIKASHGKPTPAPSPTPGPSSSPPPNTVSPPRWGDYSGAGTDPSGTSVWLGAEYATQFPLFGSIWGTAIAQAQP